MFGKNFKDGMTWLWMSQLLLLVLIKILVPHEMNWFFYTMLLGVFVIILFRRYHNSTQGKINLMDNNIKLRKEVYELRKEIRDILKAFEEGKAYKEQKKVLK